MSTRMDQARINALLALTDDSMPGQIEQRVARLSDEFFFETDARSRIRLANALEAGRHLAADLRAARTARLVAADSWA